MKSIENSLLQNEYVNNIVKYVRLPNPMDNNELCHTAIMNNQITLNRNGNFDVYNNLDINIG